MPGISKKIGCILYVRLPAVVRGRLFPASDPKAASPVLEPRPDVVVTLVLN
jgi:hypothetical protein